MRTEETEARRNYSPKLFAIDPNNPNTLHLLSFIPVRTTDGIYLMNGWGFVYPWREVKKLLDEIIRYYNQHPDEEIDQYNLLQYIQRKEDEQKLCKKSKPTRHIEAGYIYFLQGENGLVKIGRSKDYKRRLENLRTMSPVNIKLLFTIKTDDMAKLEKDLHNRFQEKRVKGEWFRLSGQEIETTKAMLEKEGYEIEEVVL